MIQTSSFARLAVTGLLTAGLLAISTHNSVALGSYSRASAASQIPASTSWLSLLSIGSFQSHNAYPGPMDMIVTQYIIGPVQAVTLTIGGSLRPTIPDNYRSTDFTGFDHQPAAK